MNRSVRAACQVALTLGWIADAATPIRAADWTIAPTLVMGGDFDSNRFLQAQGGQSESASLSASLQVQRATESTQFSLSPQLSWQNFFTRAYGNIFNREVTAAGSWRRPRGDVSITADDADQSTLTTELTETGILRTSLHQRSDDVAVTSDFNESERRATIVQLSYADTSYYGVPNADSTNLLSGYRYPSATVGERFSVSERSTLSVNAFSSEILSRMPGANTNESGLQLQYAQMLSERTHLDASGGVAKTRTPYGGQTLTLGSLQLSQDLERGSVSLSYSRNLLPYGTAVLVLRQEVRLSATRNLTEKLDLTASLDRVQNSQPAVRNAIGQSVALVQSYDNALLGLDWRFAETWKLGGQLGATRTRALGAVSYPAHDWRIGLFVTWTPHPLMPASWP